MSRKLTEEDINMLQYFWEEKGDLARFTDFKELKPLIQEQTPRFYNAWVAYKAAIREMNAACENLPKEAAGEEED